MKSNINTGTINTNYPVPGVNNSSQGFRDNFAGIKTNLETASTEISDLQGKVLVKSALTGDTMNNDMAGGQISNVLTLGFRKTTYNLGSNLSATVDIDCTKADVQWGTVTGDLSLTFSKWAPAETQGTVEVILTVTPGQKITLPDTVKLGTATINGYSSESGYIVIPSGVNRVHYSFSSIDCGTTIEIVPIDTPRVSTQLRYRNFDPTITPYTTLGILGDGPGDVAYYKDSIWICNGQYDGVTDIWGPASLGQSDTDPAGNDTSVQFNDSGFFQGVTSFTYSKTTNTMTVTNATVTDTLTVKNINSDQGNADLSNLSVKLVLANLSINGGNSGQYLKTDGAGNLTWADGASGNGGATVNNGNTNSLAYYTSTNTIESISNVTWSSGNLQISGNLYSNIANITTINVSNINISNNFVASGNVDLGQIERVKIRGGSSGKYLTTDGSGNLSWASPSVTSSSSGNGTVSNGSANTFAFYNTAGNTVSTANGISWAGSNLSVTGNANVTGNLTVENISANVITASRVITTGTATITSGSTITLAPNANSSSNVNITTGNLVVTKDISASNIIANGSFTVTGSFNLGGKTVNSTGTTGQISIDIANSKIWVCTAANTWKYASLT